MSHLKFNQLALLSLGDKVLCSNGETYEFIRLKKTKFLGKRSGQTFNIPVSMFVEVVEKGESTLFDVTSLKEGDLFYTLDARKNPVLYRFKYMINSNKVMAENPVTRTGVRMPAEIVEGSIHDFTKQQA